MSDDDITRAERARSGNPFFNTAQAGHYLGLSTRMLERMRRRGEGPAFRRHARSEEHTSELQSLMRISYAVFCLKKKIKTLSRLSAPQKHTHSIPDASLSGSTNHHVNSHAH